MVTAGATDIKTLYDAGAHVGYARTRRNPSAEPFLYATKDRTDIFDLEKTQKHLEAAAAFATSLAQSGKTLLLVGGKHEAQSAVQSAAAKAGLPFVAGRWIGGTLTNFKNIRKRIDRMEKLMADRESGELEKYTKKERLMIDREIEELQGRFGGIATLRDLPAALFIVDTRHEKTAVQEANQMKIPVMGLASSDCDFSLVQYPIPGNDTSVKSVALVTERIAEAYQQGKKAPTK
ncbi:MAG: 30S ribosomal protein S2 [Patescibacteria group bacterium]